MRLQEFEEAKKIWEKNKYLDINNFHYDCSVCEDRYDQTGHIYIDEEGVRHEFDCPACEDSDFGGHVSENNNNKFDNHENIEYRMYPIQSWNVTECKTCETIDYLCNLYYRDHTVNTEQRNEQLINQILSYEINAYKLLKQRESFGFISQQLDGQYTGDEYVEGIHDITHYLYNNRYSQSEIEILKSFDSDINNVRINQARWCSACAARKPDVIFDDK